MRGEDQRSEGFFSYVRLEARIPADHPLRAIRELVDAALAGVVAGVRQLVCARRTAVDPAGAAAAGAAAAGVLHGALGAAADGATRLQSAVPLVRRALGGRCGVGCDGVLQEPRPAARWRYRGQVLCRRAEPAAGAQAALQRALLGRRHADRGLGQHEELRSEGRRRSAVAAVRGGGGGRNAERNFHGEKRRTTRIPRPPTPTRACSAKAPARKPSSATWAI